MAQQDQAWTRCTDKHPCPLCGKKKYCATADNGDTVLCADLDAAPEGWHVAKRTQTGTVFKRGEEPKKRKQSAESRFKTMQDDLVRGVDITTRDVLAEELLGDAVESLRQPFNEALRQIGCGWNERAGAWTFPERSAQRTVRGIEFQRRGERKSKWMAKGSKRGIYFPDNLGDYNDPVLIVEGASDVAACLSIGIAAVGRPNDRGGVDDIISLCRTRHCYVVGEWDVKDHGKWPGRDAAELVASKLATAWNKQVAWAMVPDRAADARAWITNRMAADDADPDAARAELLEKISQIANLARPGDAPSSASGGRELIANVFDVLQEGKLRPQLVPLPHIAQTLHRLSGGWPRRFQGMLFVADPEPPPVGELPDENSWASLTRPDALFGWIHQNHDVRWTEKEVDDPFTAESRSPVTKSEFHQALTMTAQPNYNAIEILPREPKDPNTYFLPCTLPQSDGSALDEFMDRLNADTEMDRMLLQAMMMTLAWGGPPGRRPLFVLMSEHGRGVGKTRTAQLMTDVFGGAVTVEEHEDWNQARSRLLDDDSLNKRAVLVDNVRGKLARSGLEAVITSSSIDGKKLYKGQFSRPNTITWIITANTPSLSSDLAQRGVVVKIGKPRHADTFEEWATEFMANKRVHLIADLIALLAGEPKCEIPRDEVDRWGQWVYAILTRMERGRELMQHIREGRPAVDQDQQDAYEVHHVLTSIAQRMVLNIENHHFTIEKAQLRDWLVHSGVVDKRMSVKASTSMLKQLSTFEPLRGHLAEYAGRGQGRRWVWIAPQPDGDEVYHYDPDDHGTAEHGSNLAAKEVLDRTLANSSIWSEEGDDDTHAGSNGDPGADDHLPL